LNEIDRLLNKTKSLSKTIDNTLKMLAEEEYNVKKRQKETLQDMILLRELLKNIREVLENYFSELKSIKKKSTKSTEAVDKNERKLQ
jgi:DNA repair ATPase RecN